ncbi:hypothetical protein JKP88DRAFT_267481 [Tribonema minus]|uniref:C2 domain-containing protein n=1 Tax=Tribonema minus TaxID=303371 RepID=A0A835Z918_9STRA|nr:hypothetical protein JKP88DRAFT_267481 [Tribonema minus]
MYACLENLLLDQDTKESTSCMLQPPSPRLSAQVRKVPAGACARCWLQRVGTACGAPQSLKQHQQLQLLGVFGHPETLPAGVLATCHSCPCRPGLVKACAVMRHQLTKLHMYVCVGAHVSQNVYVQAMSLTQAELKFHRQAEYAFWRIVLRQLEGHAIEPPTDAAPSHETRRKARPMDRSLRKERNQASSCACRAESEIPPRAASTASARRFASALQNADCSELALPRALPPSTSGPLGTAVPAAAAAAVLLMYEYLTSTFLTSLMYCENSTGFQYPPYILFVLLEYSPAANVHTMCTLQSYDGTTVQCGNDTRASCVYAPLSTPTRPDAHGPDGATTLASMAVRLQRKLRFAYLPSTSCRSSSEMCMQIKALRQVNSTMSCLFEFLSLYTCMLICCSHFKSGGHGNNAALRHCWKFEIRYVPLRRSWEGQHHDVPADVRRYGRVGGTRLGGNVIATAAEAIRTTDDDPLMSAGEGREATAPRYSLVKDIPCGPQNYNYGTLLRWAIWARSLLNAAADSAAERTHAHHAGSHVNASSASRLLLTVGCFEAVQHNLCGRLTYACGVMVVAWQFRRRRFQKPMACVVTPRCSRENKDRPVILPTMPSHLIKPVTKTRYNTCTHLQACLPFYNAVVCNPTYLSSKRFTTRSCSCTGLVLQELRGDRALAAAHWARRGDEGMQTCADTEDGGGDLQLALSPHTFRLEPSITFTDVTTTALRLGWPVPNVARCPVCCATIVSGKSCLLLVEGRSVIHGYCISSDIVGSGQGFHTLIKHTGTTATSAVIAALKQRLTYRFHIAALSDEGMVIPGSSVVSAPIALPEPKYEAAWFFESTADDVQWRAYEGDALVADQQDGALASMEGDAVEAEMKKERCFTGLRSMRVAVPAGCDGGCGGIFIDTPVTDGRRYVCSAMVSTGAVLSEQWEQLTCEITIQHSHTLRIAVATMPPVPPGSCTFYLDAVELVQAGPTDFELAAAALDAAVHCSWSSPSSLTVTVAGASSLRAADVMGASDPYVCVYWCGKEIGQTQVMPMTLTPRWDETFVLPVSGAHRCAKCGIQQGSSAFASATLKARGSDTSGVTNASGADVMAGVLDNNNAATLRSGVIATTDGVLADGGCSASATSITSLCPCQEAERCLLTGAERTAWDPSTTAGNNSELRLVIWDYNMSGEPEYLGEIMERPSLCKRATPSERLVAAAVDIGQRMRAVAKHALATSIAAARHKTSAAAPILPIVDESATSLPSSVPVEEELVLGHGILNICMRAFSLPGRAFSGPSDECEYNKLVTQAEAGELGALLMQVYDAVKRSVPMKEEDAAQALRAKATAIMQCAAPLAILQLTNLRPCRQVPATMPAQTAFSAALNAFGTTIARISGSDSADSIIIKAHTPGTAGAGGGTHSALVISGGSSSSDNDNKGTLATVAATSHNIANGNSSTAEIAAGSSSSTAGIAGILVCMGIGGQTDPTVHQVCVEILAALLECGGNAINPLLGYKSRRQLQRHILQLNPAFPIAQCIKDGIGDVAVMLDLLNHLYQGNQDLLRAHFIEVDGLFGAVAARASAMPAAQSLLRECSSGHAPMDPRLLEMYRCHRYALPVASGLWPMEVLEAVTRELPHLQPEADVYSSREALLATRRRKRCQRIIKLASPVVPLCLLIVGSAYIATGQASDHDDKPIAPVMVTQGVVSCTLLLLLAAVVAMGSGSSKPGFGSNAHSAIWAVLPRGASLWLFPAAAVLGALHCILLIVQFALATHSGRPRHPLRTALLPHPEEPLIVPQQSAPGGVRQLLHQLLHQQSVGGWGEAYRARWSHQPHFQRAVREGRQGRARQQQQLSRALNA